MRIRLKTRTLLLIAGAISVVIGLRSSVSEMEGLLRRLEMSQEMDHLLVTLWIVGLWWLLVFAGVLIATSRCGPSWLRRLGANLFWIGWLIGIAGTVFESFWRAISVDGRFVAEMLSIGSGLPLGLALLISVLLFKFDLKA